jgi:hypothetical protein
MSKATKIPFGQNLDGKETTIRCLVSVQLMISVCYDDKIPSERQLKKDLLENFLCHPAIAEDSSDIERTADGLEYKLDEITSP